MEQLEMFIPEEGDELLIIEDLPELSLFKGDIVTYWKTTETGVVCKRIPLPVGVKVPHKILRGIYKGTIVKLSFK